MLFRFLLSYPFSPRPSNFCFFNVREGCVFSCLSTLIPTLLQCSQCVLHAVATGIFEIIVDQSPYAVEDLMKELGSNNDEEDVSAEDKQENEGVHKTKGEEELLNGLGSTC